MLHSLQHTLCRLEAQRFSRGSGAEDRWIQPLQIAEIEFEWPSIGLRRQVHGSAGCRLLNMKSVFFKESSTRSTDRRSRFDALSLSARNSAVDFLYRYSQPCNCTVLQVACRSSAAAGGRRQNFVFSQQVRPNGHENLPQLAVQQ